MNTNSFAGGGGGGGGGQSEAEHCWSSKMPDVSTHNEVYILTICELMIKFKIKRGIDKVPKQSVSKFH